MLNLRRAGFAGVCCAVALAGAQIANAASTQKAKKIELTQRLVVLSASGSNLTNVGTSDGKIAGASVHGALRAVATSPGPSKFAATGTLFYPAGTLRYTLNGTVTSKPDGSLSLTGAGRFTGGTGTYTGAHGNFSGTGSKPANSFETFSFKGKVSYR